MTEITFLGTGSAVPTARRNHPALLLKYKAENILFDCGEGTQRQFRKARLNPCKLTRIFITHWHGDHVLGIPGLFYTLNLNGYRKTLYIYGPRGTKKYLNAMMKIFANTGKLNLKVKEISSGIVVDENDFKIVAEKMEHGTSCLAYKFIEKDRLRIDKKKLGKLKIANCPELKKLSQGKNVVINGKKIKSKDITYLEKGKSIAVVLDTRENKNILKIARDADLLICESTFFNENELAKEYGHLSVEQGARIAKKAGVGKLILMHISQRYEKDMKEFLTVARKIFKNTDLARDLDVVEV